MWHFREIMATASVIEESKQVSKPKANFTCQKCSHPLKLDESFNAASKRTLTDLTGKHGNTQLNVDTSTTQTQCARTDIACQLALRCRHWLTLTQAQAGPVPATLPAMLPTTLICQCLCFYLSPCPWPCFCLHLHRPFDHRCVRFRRCHSRQYANAALSSTSV